MENAVPELGVLAAGDEDGQFRVTVRQDLQRSLEGGEGSDGQGIR